MMLFSRFNEPPPNVLMLAPFRTAPFLMEQMGNLPDAVLAQLLHFSRGKFFLNVDGRGCLKRLNTRFICGKSRKPLNSAMR